MIGCQLRGWPGSSSLLSTPLLLLFSILAYSLFKGENPGI
jgi:hypothetical protein